MNQIALAQNGPTMTSREIAELTLSTHDSVLKSIRRYAEQGIVSPNETPYVHPQNGQTYSEFHLGFRDAMFIASGYSPNLRARIIDRWMELEQTEKKIAVPQTFAEALRLAADQQETIQKQAEQLAIAAPAVEFVVKYVESTSGSKGFREVCKVLQAKEPEFRDFLQDSKIMYRLGGQWTAYQNHIDAGRFEVKTGTANDHAYSQAKFTPKGIEWVAGEWAKHILRGSK